MFLISTNQTSVNFSESSIFKKCAYDTDFPDEFLDFSETTASFSSLDTLVDAPWYPLPGKIMKVGDIQGCINEK